MLFCNIIFVAVLCIDLERHESFQLPETTFKFFFFRLLPLSEEGFNGSHSSALVPSQPTGPLLGFENFIRNYVTVIPVECFICYFSNFLLNQSIIAFRIN